MKIPIPPFIVPPLDVASHTGWALITSAGTQDLPVDLEHWDYQAVLEVVGGVSVNRRRLLDESQLAQSSGLELIMAIKSHHTSVQRTLVRQRVPAQDVYSLQIKASIAGHDLGGKLDITTYIVASDPVPTSALGATAPGSILWSAVHVCHLEGIGSQFPTDSEDFSITRPSHANAAWFLEIDDSDLQAVFMSSVRLVVNSGNPAMKRMLNGESTGETSTLRKYLDFDISRQLVNFALQNDEVIDMESDIHDVSLGGVLRNTLSRFWPNTAPDALRLQLKSNPGRIEFDIQHSRGTGR